MVLTERYRNIVKFLTRGGNAQTIIFVVFCLLLYLLVLGIYARLADNILFFPVSCFLAVIIPLMVYIIFRRYWNKYIFAVARPLLLLNSTLIIIVFAVFGPTFIDRSISYHLAFLAVERGYLDKAELETSGYTKAVFEKRYQDAQITGFITPVDNEVDIYVPTKKAKILYAILKPLGEATSSLNEYKSLLHEISKTDSGER